MNLLVPSSVTIWGGATQFIVARLVFCCRFQPVEGNGQVTSTVFVGVKLTASTGASVATYVPFVTVVLPCETPTSKLAGVVQPLISVKLTMWEEPAKIDTVAPLERKGGKPSISHWAPAATAPAGRILTCKDPRVTGANDW